MQTRTKADRIIKNLSYSNFKKKNIKSNRKSFCDHEAFVYYKECSTKFTREKVKDFIDHGKIIVDFYKEVANSLCEQEGGVYIEGLGYFGIACVYKTFKKKSLKTRRMVIGEQYIFKPLFVGTSSTFLSWTMDNAFIRSLAKKITQKVKTKEIPYTFNISLVK